MTIDDDYWFDSIDMIDREKRLKTIFERHYFPSIIPRWNFHHIPI